MSTVGLFGGTFDPMHSGHLDVARVAQRALALDEVWFIPARRPPHRTPPVASAAHRFAMVALAVNTEPGLRVCDAEMESDGPSYTIDTLGRIESRHPTLTGTLVFITGADAFREIKTWSRWEELIDRCHFAVVSRSGCPASDLYAALPDLADRMSEGRRTVSTSQRSIFLIDAETAHVSSSEVRRTLGAGRRAPALLPEVVAEYAVRHGLYTPATVLEAPRG